MPSAQARRKEIPCLIGNAQSAAQTTYARVGPSFAGNRGAAENQQSEWRGSESSHPHEDQCQARNWTKSNGGKKAGRALGEEEDSCLESSSLVHCHGPLCPLV